MNATDKPAVVWCKSWKCPSAYPRKLTPTSFVNTSRLQYQTWSKWNSAVVRPRNWACYQCRATALRHAAYRWPQEQRVVRPGRTTLRDVMNTIRETVIIEGSSYRMKDRVQS